jgi:hypothetical protein
MTSAITTFGESGFIFNFVGYELVIKFLKLGADFRRWEEKIKCQKMNVNFFPTKLG